MYTSFIRPVMEYGDTVWTCCGKGNAQELERLQNRAARIVTKRSYIDTVLSNLKWDSLECRRERQVFNLVKKSLRGQCPQFLRTHFTFNKDVVRRVTIGRVTCYTCLKLEEKLRSVQSITMDPLLMNLVLPIRTIIWSNF